MLYLHFISLLCTHIIPNSQLRLVCEGLASLAQLAILRCTIFNHLFIHSITHLVMSKTVAT